jgi:hypothetical protein
VPSNCHIVLELTITALQYGGPSVKFRHVMSEQRGARMRRWLLSDASTGQSPGSLAEKLSLCKPARLNDFSRSGGEGMAHFLQSGYRILWPLRTSRYRVVKLLVNYPDTVKFIEGSGAVRVC